MAKKTSKNQLTLPKEIVEEFPGVEYFGISIQDNTIVLVPMNITPSQNLQRIRNKMKKLGLTDKDVTKAIKWARGK